MGRWVIIGTPSAQQLSSCFTPCLSEENQKQTMSSPKDQWLQKISVIVKLLTDIRFSHQ
jgi:hypothetical protein